MPLHPRALAIIPARQASTRLPGKVLLEIGGVTMLERVYRQAQAAACFEAVIVATDDQGIAQAVETFGGEYAITGTHDSGTDRCAEALRQRRQRVDVVVNLQADQPFTTPEMLHRLLEPYQPLTGHPAMATLMAPFETLDDYVNPHVVKVLVNQQHQALYFSRCPLPFRQMPCPYTLSDLPVYRHIGIYAFRPDMLVRFPTLPPSTLELCEQLEQLRVLDAGISIQCVRVPHGPLEVNTLADLERARALIPFLTAVE